jgi:hypothetical protein
MYYELNNAYSFIACFFFSLFRVLYCRLCDWGLVCSIRKITKEDLLILCLIIIITIVIIIIIIIKVWFIIIIIIIMWITCDSLEWTIICSHICIYCKNSLKLITHANFRTTPKAVNKFHIPVIYFLFGPGSDASYRIIISDITTVACKNLVVVSKALYEFKYDNL